MQSALLRGIAISALALLASCSASPSAVVDELERSLRIASSSRFPDSVASEDATLLVDGAVLVRGGFVETGRSYEAPFALTARVLTDGDDVRVRFGATEWVWSAAGAFRIDGGPAAGLPVWNADALPRGRSVEVRVVVHRDGMAVYSDGAYRADGFADFGGEASPIRIASSGALRVDSMTVVTDGLGASLLDALDPVSRLARGVAVGGAQGGLHVAGEVDPKKGDAVQIAAPFDLRRDWRLDLSMMPGDVSNWGQMVFVWGDRRAGRDTIFVRQRARGLEAGTWGDPDAYLVAMLPESSEPRWVAVTLSFDAAARRLSLAFDGHVVAECPAGCAFFDQAMPACIGQAFGNDQLFTGRVRDVVLENR